MIKDRLRSESLAQQGYSPFTHYSIRSFRTGMMEVEGVTRTVHHVILEWRLDRDGRDRVLHELNLGHLQGEPIDAVQEPSRGARRFASLTLIGGTIRGRFFPKD